jgi:glycosyltransferase involved in cell wall biosynthesis
MRVLYFTDNNSDHNRRFLAKLAHSGHEILYLSLSGAASNGWLPTGIRSVVFPHKFTRHSSPTVLKPFATELRKIIIELKPNLVHAGPIQSCTYLAALTGVHPLLAMSWGSDILADPDRGADWKEATTRALSSADGLLCDCDAVKRRVQELAPSDRRYVVQFPWGLEGGAFGPDGEKIALPWTEQSFVFICTRSWEPLYGIPLLLEAFRRAHSHLPRLRLLLIGQGSQEFEIQNFVKEHGLAKEIMIERQAIRGDMPRYFRSADAYISCAPSDGTSISLLEAMATGLPAIVADNPSNREWLAEGENGWFADPESSSSFAERIAEVAGLDPHARLRAAALSRKTVHDRADWDENFPLLLRAYSDLLERAGQS